MLVQQTIAHRVQRNGCVHAAASMDVRSSCSRRTCRVLRTAGACSPAAQRMAASSQCRSFRAAAGIDIDALGLDIPDLGDEVRAHQETLGATFNVSRVEGVGVAVRGWGVGVEGWGWGSQEGRVVPKHGAALHWGKRWVAAVLMKWVGYPNMAGPRADGCKSTGGRR